MARKDKQLDLRTAWPTEDRHFTPWLAKDENIQLLGEVVGLDLQVEAMEKRVGPFRADIVCRETRTNAVVIIENQLERTDHTHLGQLLTYAAGLEGATMIWIAREFKEEHRKALVWLDEISGERCSFHAVEVEIWGSGKSLWGSVKSLWGSGESWEPRFCLLSEPADQLPSRETRDEQEPTKALTPLKQLQLDYWEALGERLRAAGSSIVMSNPQPAYRLRFGIGRAGFALRAYANMRDQRIGVCVYLTGDHAEKHLDQLRRQRKAIERRLGLRLGWHRDRGSEIQQIIVMVQRNPNDREQWPELHKWQQQTLEDFDRVFRPLIAELD